MTSSADVRTAYLAAADAFLDLVRTIPLSALDGPGLGDWDLRSLLGHTGRAFTTVAAYLGTRADSAEVASPADYFVVAGRLVAADPAANVERGREAGHALGAEPWSVLDDLRRRAALALEALGAEDPVVSTFAGGMRVSDYLPTRTFELVVHTDDVARAVGHEHRAPAIALEAALEVATATAVALGHGGDLLRSLTGRGPLAGVSVVP